MSVRIQNDINKDNDNYYTPLYLTDWAVNYSVEIVGGGPGIQLLEPGCGEFYPFARSAAKLGITAYAFDNQVDFSDETLTDHISLYSEVSFLDDGISDIGLDREFDIIATNPPFSKAEEFIWKGLDILDPRGVMILLLKLPFLASKRRRTLFSERPPKEVHVIQRRPSFVMEGSKKGKTDVTEYGFYIWLGEAQDGYFKKYGGRNTILRWLDNTQLEGYSVGQGPNKTDKRSKEVDK